MKPSLVVKLAVSLAVALALFVTLPVGQRNIEPGQDGEGPSKTGAQNAKRSCQIPGREPPAPHSPRRHANYRQAGHDV